MVQVGQGVEECHPLWCLHRASSDEEEPQDFAAVADHVRLVDAYRHVKAAVGAGSDWFQLHRRVNTPRRSRMNVTGSEDEPSEMN